MSSSLPDPSRLPEDALEWHPLVLTTEKIRSLWEKFQKFPIAFDDFTKGDMDHFIAGLMDRNSVFFEIGDELGLAAATAIRPRLDAFVHLIMFDLRLRGREDLFKNMIRYVVDEFALRRISAAVPENRGAAGALLKRLGFTEEGTLRKAFMSDGGYLDIKLFGILREEL